MSPKRKKQICMPKNESEAWMMVASGLLYFMRAHTVKMLIGIAVIFGAPGYIVIDWYTTDRATVEEAKPIGESWTLIPNAYAGGGVPIKINGKLYGYADTTVVAWKLIGEPRFLIYDKSTKQVTSVEIPSARKFAK